MKTLTRQSLLENLRQHTGLHSLGSGVEWHDTFNIWTALLFLVLSVILCALLGYYLHHVLPSRFGTRLPWNFFLTSNNLSGDAKKMLPIERADPNKFQSRPEHDDGQSGIRVRRLRKTFCRGQVIAIDGLDIDVRIHGCFGHVVRSVLQMYPGEVFALLGPNGAGKTTFLDVLTGICGGDSGEIRVNGENLSTQLGSELRESLGFCPQENFLFDGLTVRQVGRSWRCCVKIVSHLLCLRSSQHLEFYARLKGKKEALPTEAADLLSSLGLESKANATASTLSGGQKRLLSCVIRILSSLPHPLFFISQNHIDFESVK